MGLVYFIFFWIGASVFSFVNVLIYRVPRKISFVGGRSFCPSCGTKLKFYDMIPVFSYLFLKGKCRKCRAKISPRYPAVELLGGITAVWCAFLIPLEAGAGIYLLKVCFLLLTGALLAAVAFVDVDTMEIPNGFVLALACLGIVSLFLFPEVSLVMRMIGFFAVSVPMLLLTVLIPGAFGGGDIKLMAAAGFLLGVKLIAAAFFFAVLTGGIYGIYLLAGKKKGGKDHFAFGPFLCIGIWAAVCWGNEVISWYLNLLP
ncbi:prepilin peptidase [Anaerostipes sp.]|uniref:prepilin peptidase n=1 Tax=Anaerostipes sp. TaxID=1872530 RepID=UPI0025BD07F2|nr:A24 family peptidase [Anaerostipes sp.]MBS7009298.1 prepilin peptidase [Anaerostipes sp.]